MTNTQYPYYKERLTKWFLTVTLLFSIFTISGYVGNSQSLQQETNQSELVISHNPKITQRAISYKKGLELIRFISPLNSSDKSWINSIITYNILTKVRLDNISRQFYSHKSANHFLQAKTVRQSSDEEFFFTFIG